MKMCQILSITLDELIIHFNYTNGQKQEIISLLSSVTATKSARK